MSNLRFGLMVAVAFVLAFIGVWLGSKGTPVTAMRSAPANPDVRVSSPEARPPAPGAEKSAQQGPRKAADNPKSMQGDNDPGRNRMRLTAIEAANAYVRAPCDQAVKAAFVVATATYVKAQADAKSFSTPLDARVREAIEAAFDAGGVSKDDLPSGTPLWPAATAKSRADAEPLCAVGRRAETIRR
jgi:hypothetical protein